MTVRSNKPDSQAAGEAASDSFPLARQDSITGGGFTSRKIGLTTTKNDNYYSGLNQKLLNAIPCGSRNILEFGCAEGLLGAAYKASQPQARWTGVDLNSDALKIASRHLDQTFAMDLNSPDFSSLRTDYDCIVFGNLLEHLVSPQIFLDSLQNISTNASHLVCCVPNMCHASVIERLLAGDISYDESGLLDNTHLKFLSLSAVCKLFLDAGWLPNLKDQYIVGHPNESYLKKLVEAAKFLGVPAKTAAQNILRYQLIIDCKRSQIFPSDSVVHAPVSVVVPVTNPSQFQLNVLSSPGFREINAEIIPITNASSPAEALAQGEALASSDWIFFCHQDTYLPRYSGRRLLEIVRAVSAERIQQILIGFAGLTAPGKFCGLVIDRGLRFDHPCSGDVVSIDEFAVLLSKNSNHKLDEAIGWHAWATDLCISARLDPELRRCAVERIPIFHNSNNDGELSQEFYRSIAKVFQKYPGLDIIPTLNGIFSRNKTVAMC